MPVDPAKAALRAVLRDRRAALAPAWRDEASGALAAHILSDPAWRAANGVAAFVGVRGEPDTRPLLDAALAAGKRLWLPRVLDAKAGRTVMVEVTDLARQLQPAPFGLQEPQTKEGQPELASLTSDGPIDLMLVPGLGFSSTGARIGFGRGHYDRLLASTRHEARPGRMALAFAAFVDPPEGLIPMGPHDVPMHAIATEQGIVRCRTPESR